MHKIMPNMQAAHGSDIEYIAKWNVLYENGSCGFHFIT